jgi:tetratricopeptide (TPR) repeat protein
MNTNPPALIEAENLYRIGTEFLESDPAKAAELLTESLRLNPDMPPALYNRASAFARIGHDAEAVADMERLEVVAPKIGKHLRAQMRLAAGGYVSLAEEAYHSQNFAVAIKKCESALAYCPEWADAWVVKGLAFKELGESEKALECFNNGADIEPTNWSVYINRAALHQQENRLPQALSDYTKAIELRPDEPDGYSRRSALHSVLGEQDKAATDTAKAARLKNRR